MTDQACGCEADSGDPIINVIVKCKAPVYVVMIALANQTFVKKQYHN